MSILNVKYSAYAKATPPRPIRMEAGGWAGAADKMVDGSEPQPWHCLPFVEGSIYGLELIYPYETECRVIGENGTIRFDFDYTKEPGNELTGGEFIAFAPQRASRYYLFNARLDLQAPPGYVLRTEPHPRYFTDDTGTVPLSMIAHVQSEWWPKRLFVVFRAPRQGEQHIFRKGEAYAQILFVPNEMKYELTPLKPEEEAIRRELEQDIGYSKLHISDNVWHNAAGDDFSNHYKILARTFAKDGTEGVSRIVTKAKETRDRELPKGKSIEECVTIAHQKLRDEKYDDARAIYAFVLNQNPNQAEAMSFLGICNACLGAPNVGIKMMQQAISLRPDVPLFRSNLGEILRQLGKLAEAEGVLREAMRASPQDLQTMLTLGVVIAQQGRLEEALQVYRDIVAKAPQYAVPYSRIGRILAQQGKPGEARRSFEKALAIDPKLAEAQQGLKELPQDA